MHLFTYGSLMFPEVWSMVVRGDYQSQPARLYGYQRLRINSESYPGAVAATTSDFIDGQLYMKIAPEDMERLDLFEGDDYEKVQAPLSLSEEGDVVMAQVYLYKHSERLDTQAWDVEWFAREGIKQFMAEYGGFNR